MRYPKKSLVGVLVAGMLAAGAATADHARPGIFSDVGTPPAGEDDSHSNVSTDLMVERCTQFVSTALLDTDKHIRSFEHSYGTGFCLGWVNASMAYLNVRDKDGAPALGVCLPEEGIHSNEVMKIFLDFVAANPGDKKYNPSFIIYWAMLEKFPCIK